MVVMINKKTNKVGRVSIANGITEDYFIEKYQMDEDSDTYYKKVEYVPECANLIFENGEVKPDEKANKDFLDMVNKIERNRLLSATDIFMVSDFPISEEDKKEVVKYRDELRNFGETKELPKVPAFLIDKV